MTILLVKVFRQMGSSDSAGVLQHMGRLAPEVLHYIDQNCFEKISVSDLARKCFYNPSYFSRMFKECFGKTLTDFIQEKRVNEAKRLLQQTDMSVEEIFQCVGYNEKTRFYKAFRQLTGLSPGEFRQKSHKAGAE